ncbi:hypothetical protein [Billgrantia endophytica]|uniref:hypothetical protein n=1 Tax=Billgrantia endophytica TaxID=2033802 RepID=UPI00105490B6|nr:hypothetical protein [Halomonas endophytica]
MNNKIMKTVGIALVSTTMFLSTSTLAHSLSNEADYMAKSKSLTEVVESTNGYLSAVLPQSFIVIPLLMVAPALNLFIDFDNYSDNEVASFPNEVDKG